MIVGLVKNLSDYKCKWLRSSIGGVKLPWAWDT